MRIFAGARTPFSLIILALLLPFTLQNVSPANANSQGIEIADQLMDLFASYDGVDPVYDDADYDSSSDITTIYGFLFENPKEDASLTIQRLEMLGVRIHASGAISADELVASKVTLDDRGDETAIAIGTMTVQDPLFPEKAIVDGKNKAFVYRLATEYLLEDTVIASEGKTLPIARIFARRGELDGDIPETFQLDIENVVFPVDDMDDPSSQEQLGRMGYDVLDISMSAIWSWDSAAERMDVGPLQVSIRDMGATTLELAVGGVSREFLLTFEDDDRRLELAQLMSFISLNYTVDDDSVTDRIINVMSEDADLSPNTMIGIWVDLARQQMTQLTLPEDFIKMVVKATEYFLNNPGRISLSAEPEAPIPAAQLMGSVMFGPAAIIPMLNITVTAE